MKKETNLDFNGMAGAGVNRKVNRYEHNHWSGHANDGRLVNMGRGPTRGNQDYDVMEGKHREPPTSEVPKFATGQDMFTGRGQYRGEGGTTVKPHSADARINVGRGPTKGNQQ